MTRHWFSSASSPERAGLSFLGKNTLAIVPGAGSYFHLGVLLVDVELAEDEAARPPEGCGRCRACLDACPTGALEAAHRIDARRCVSYLTIEFDGIVPRDLRAALEPVSLAVTSAVRVSVQSLRQHDAARCRARAGGVLARAVARGATQLIGNRLPPARPSHCAAARDQKAAGANAAIALGNTGSSAAVPLLAAVLAEDRPVLVQVHAAWGARRALVPTWPCGGRHRARRAAEPPQPGGPRGDSCGAHARSARRRLSERVRCRPPLVTGARICPAAPMPPPMHIETIA